jgi:hypothetical protein
MLINKILLERYKCMIVKSTDFAHIRYLMDFGVYPIVKWISKYKKNPLYVMLLYSNLSVMQKETLSSCIYPLDISDIKKLLFNIKISNLQNEKITNISCLNHLHIIYIKRDDLLC